MKQFQPSITFRQVKAWAKLAGKAERPVGLCQNKYACLVSEAILHKYSQLTAVSVWIDSDYDRDTCRWVHVLVVNATEKPDSERSDYGDEWEYEWRANNADAQKICGLIERFDTLGVYNARIYAGQVLPLFELAA